MSYVELPGVDLWYSDAGGDGLPVVFLHAASGNSDTWECQFPAFPNGGYRCVVYDRRGWGRSRTNKSGEQPGFACDDLNGLVDHLQLDAFHLIGTAAGAVVALDYALAHFERLRSLVVSNSIGGIKDADYLNVQKRLRLPEIIRALPIELRELGASYRCSQPEGTGRWLEIQSNSRHAEHEELGPQLRNPQELRNHLTCSLLRSLQVPVLVVAGEADMLTPPALMRLFAKHIPNCKFATVPEAGHAASWERPQVWNRLVLEFIGQH